MLTQLFNRLQGQVAFEAECPFPERVLNLCSAQGLSFWDVHWHSPTCLSCTMSRQDFYRLRRQAKSLECTLHLTKKQGVPFFFGHFRQRYALVYGAVLTLAVLLGSSFFIWDFTVYGNTTVSDTAILRALQSNGVQIGTFGLNVDSEDLRNHVLLDLPELCWISVNVSGCRAYVQVQERVMPPTLQLRSEPSNVVASQDGLVLWVNALDGQAMVLPRTTVVSGQLLISGISDIQPYGAQIRTGLGTVTARTWNDFSTIIPHIVEKKVYDQEITRQWAVIFGTKRINFFGSSSIWGANCDKIVDRTQLSLWGLPLPITLVCETSHPFTVVEVATTAQDAQARGEDILTAYLHSQLGDEDTVSSTLTTVSSVAEGFQVTLQSECVAQIGKTVPIYTDDNPPPSE